MSLTIVSLSNRTPIMFSIARESGHLISKRFFSSIVIWWMTKLSGWLEMTSLSNVTKGDSTGSKLRVFYSSSKLWRPSSCFTYFFLEDVSTKSETFCISASSSLLQALFNCLCLLSMLFLTCANFWTVHLLTSISVFTFSLASASNLARVEASLSLN